MILRHVAIICSSENNSDRFYKDLMGLEKSEPKNLPEALSKAIFNVDAKLLMIHYQGKAAHFEVFITDCPVNKNRRIAHVCLEVDNLKSFLQKCRDLDVEISQIPRGERTLTFIRDFDGNLFEIKQE